MGGIRVAYKNMQKNRVFIQNIQNMVATLSKKDHKMSQIEEI